MDHSLQITLNSEQVGRLTISLRSNVRSTAIENELCQQAEDMINGDKEHGKYAPWKVISSSWQR